MFKNKFRYKLLFFLLFFLFFFFCRHLPEQWETKNGCKRLHDLYGLNDLHCGGLFLERISIAHNGSKITCNIEITFRLCPKACHITKEEGGRGRGGQVIKSPHLCPTECPLHYKTHPKVLSRCILHKHVCVRKADSIM